MNGYRIAEARKAKGMSQSELGLLVGVSQQAISKYESPKGDIDGEVLIALSAALDVSISYLLGLDEPARVENQYTLSNDERLLIECYRACLPEGRSAILTTARALRDSAKEQKVNSRLLDKVVNQ